MTAHGHVVLQLGDQTFDVGVTLRELVGRDGSPPPAGGYLPLTATGDFPVPAGQFASLPDDDQAAAMVTRSSWEPRPTNVTANAARPPAGWTAPPPHPSTNPYPPEVWARVTGACPLTDATTDELLQWAAAKWGLSDELVRAQMVQESHWYQDLRWSDSMPPDVLADMGITARPAGCPLGSAVFGHGYGDHAPGGGTPPLPPEKGSPDEMPARQYNEALGGTLIDTSYRGREYGPASFGISQCKWFANTSPGPTGLGCYPHTELVTAVALDVYAATLRAQYEGWNAWMGGSYDAYRAAPGGETGVWGSVGNWFGADWHSAMPPDQLDENASGSEGYAANVYDFLLSTPWLAADF
jgi:hypothetical protein